MFWSQPSPRPSSARRPFRPRVEHLEEIITPTTFTVTTASDAVDHAGLVSLRDALASAKADPNADADTIEFDASVRGTITLEQGQLDVTSAVTITGPGAKLLTVSGDVDGDTGVFNVNDGTASEVLVTIRGLTLTKGSRGAVANDENLTLEEVAVTDNNGGFGGGLQNTGTMTVVRSLIANNSAMFDGGGIYSENGLLTLTNSTVVNNKAERGGGVLSSTRGGAATTVVVTGSTIAGNEATGSVFAQGIGGGMVLGILESALVRDTIIADNTAASLGTDLYLGTIQTFTADHILLETQSEGARTIDDGVDGNIIGVDPKLGVLADNGGPTQTMAIPADSAARNAGSADTSHDQRDLAVEGPRDIGAYEAHAPAAKSSPSTNYKAKKGTVLRVNDPAKGVLKAFRDLDGDALTAVLAVGPPATKGKLTLRPDGTFMFVPKPNVTGKVTFKVKAADDKGLASQPLKFTITIV